MTANYDCAVGIDRLKDHYKHCIRLSASNKINPKNAFDLQLIDYMQDLVSSTEDGQMNFKIASSALDVGAKIYSNRVDRIQSEAQKVASSILMALDGQQTGKHSTDDDDDNGDDNNTSGACEDGQDDEEGSGNAKEKDKRKVSRKKNNKTVVDDENSLNGKLDKIIMGDAFLDGLSRDFDMSCPAALICYNALTQPNCLLTIESNNLRKNYMEHEAEQTARTDEEFVTLVSKRFNCAEIIRSNQSNKICPRLETFLFNDRSTTISGDKLEEETMRPGSSTGRVYISKPPTGGNYEFNPEHYGPNNDSDYGDDHFDGDVDSSNEAERPIVSLDKIAASKPTEYGYTSEHHRLMNTWAGPHAWKVMKVIQKDPLKSSKKRARTEQKPIDFNEDHDPSQEELADKDIRHSADVIKRWKKPLLPQDHNLNEDKVRKSLVKAFLRPEDTYHCRKTPAEALMLVGNDHNYHRDKQGDEDSDGGFASPAMGGFDDVHDDSDLEFRADPVVDGEEVAIYGATINNTLAQQADLEFAGENLIEQPFEVAQVNITFAKIAKKMDVRKLKRVMWDLLLPPVEQSTDDQTPPPPTPSEFSFSNLYGELPVRISNRMANDLSQPIAFVTLLHLANEKNLRLVPNPDLKDFFIEQVNE